jgi:hypothetical protein
MMNPDTSARNIFTQPILRVLALALLLSLMCLNAKGQSATDGATPLSMTPGAPTGSYSLGDFDNINLFNGHLNFTLPLVTAGGRGGVSLPIVYKHEQTWRVESYIPCYLNGVPCETYYYPTYNWWNNTGRYYGALRLDYRTAQHGVLECFDPTRNTPEYSLTTLTLTMPDGTEYELRDQKTGGKPLRLLGGCTGSWSPSENRGRVWATAGGTSATFISDQTSTDNGNTWLTGYLFFKDGARYRIEDGVLKWVRDRNGNSIEFTYLNYHQGADFNWYTDTIITDSVDPNLPEIEPESVASRHVP